jgi:hypothetical protein
MNYRDEGEYKYYNLQLQVKLINEKLSRRADTEIKLAASILCLERQQDVLVP